MASNVGHRGSTVIFIDAFDHQEFLTLSVETHSGAFQVSLLDLNDRRPTRVVLVAGNNIN